MTRHVRFRSSMLLASCLLAMPAGDEEVLLRNHGCAVTLPGDGWFRAKDRETAKNNTALVVSRTDSALLVMLMVYSVPKTVSMRKPGVADSVLAGIAKYGISVTSSGFAKLGGVDAIEIQGHGGKETWLHGFMTLAHNRAYLMLVAAQHTEDLVDADALAIVHSFRFLEQPTIPK